MRSPNLNYVIIAGNLTKTPELKFMKDGKSSILSFTIAYNKSWKDKNDEWQKKTSFFDVKCWNKDYLANQLDKGMAVIVEGNIEQETWESDEGKRSKIVVVANKINILKDEHVTEQPAIENIDTDTDVPF